MSSKLSELVTASQTRLQAYDEAVSSLEYTHNWEMDLRDHSVQHASWGHGTYLYGLHYYVVNTMGYDTAYSWQSGIVSSKIFLGYGDDKVYGNIGSDKVHTGAGDDLIRGGAGDDQLLGGDGDDIIYGDEGDDILFGGAGDDTIYAGTGSNSAYYGVRVFPRTGISENYYGDGDDVLFGGDGDDTLIDTGSGNNVFAGGRGMDKIHMGTGQNIVIVDQTIGENYYSYDFVTGFGSDDVLRFKGLTGNEASLVEVKAELGIYWREEYGGTTVYADRDNRPAEIIVFLEGFTGFTLKNFGIELPEIIPEPTPVSVTEVTITEPQTETKTETVVSEFSLTQEEKTPAPKTTDPVSVTLRRGTKESDRIIGDDGTDFIYALEGNDWVHGRDGNDELRGGDGEDRLFGGNGDDVIYGENGNDSLRGGLGNDVLIGGKGTDVGYFLYHNANSQATEQVTANLTLKANRGKTFKKTLENGEEVSVKRFWVDLNNNGVKDDGDEFDYYTGIERFAIRGGLGDDTIVGANGSDDLDGKSGNDRLSGKGGVDRLKGGDGKDVLKGGKGDDLLYGEAGNDVLRGGRDDDELYGGLGNDVLKGEKGNDILDGGDGRDILIGGSGDDIFVVTQESSPDNADVIRDFGNGKDRVDFGDNVSTVYVRQVNGDTILQNSDAADAEVYAVLKGYTGTLDNIESTYNAPDDFTFVDIL